MEYALPEAAAFTRPSARQSDPPAPPLERRVPLHYRRTSVYCPLAQLAQGGTHVTDRGPPRALPTGVGAPPGHVARRGPPLDRQTATAQDTGGPGPPLPVPPPPLPKALPL